MKSTFDLYGLAKIEGITEISLRSGVLGEQIVFDVLGSREASRTAHGQIMCGATSARLYGSQISMVGIQSEELNGGYRYTAKTRPL